MTDTTTFEDRLAEQLRAYAAPAARPPSREAVASAVEGARNVRGGLGWPRLGRPSMAFAAGAAAVVLAVVGFGILGGLPDQPILGEPTGTHTPTPTVTPTATSQPSISASMWPQSTLEDVRAAQARADAGDPDYRWQVGAQLVEDDPNNQVELELIDRFLRDTLGWEAYLFSEGGSFSDWEGASMNGWVEGTVTGQRYLRCAPGRTNSLYPGESCAPTIDDLSYESVSLDIAQPDRQGRDGIWVVSAWTLTAPFTQADPVAVEAQATERLEEYLAARIEGSGAEEYVVDAPPLLYATTAGTAYERYEIERTEGPGWPYGNMKFSVRLFADGDETVVEQPVHWDAPSRQLWSVDSEVTEDGHPIPRTYEFFDGQVSVTATPPWIADDLEHWSALRRGGFSPSDEQIYLIDDPRPATGDCFSGTRATDAEALARAISSHPDLVASTPAAVTLAGHAALSMEVTLAAGASCEGQPGTRVLMYQIDPNQRVLWVDEGSRIRLYLLDAPEGSSYGILAIAIKAPESRFDSIVEEAVPILESVEFHVP